MRLDNPIANGRISCLPLLVAHPMADRVGQFVWRGSGEACNGLVHRARVLGELPFDVGKLRVECTCTHPGGWPRPWRTILDAHEFTDLAPIASAQPITPEHRNKRLRLAGDAASEGFAAMAPAEPSTVAAPKAAAFTGERLRAAKDTDGGERPHVAKGSASRAPRAAPHDGNEPDGGERPHREHERLSGRAVCRRFARRPASALPQSAAAAVVAARGRGHVMLSSSEDDDGSSHSEGSSEDSAYGARRHRRRRRRGLKLPPRLPPGTSPPTAERVLELLRVAAREFAPACRHLNRRHPCGDSPPVAVTLGATSHANTAPRLSEATRRHAKLTQTLCAFATDAISRGLGGSVATFTTIQVNRNCRMKFHCDRNNEGPSLAIALGDFEGGDLYVAKRGALDLHNRWQVWNADRQCSSTMKVTIRSFGTGV